MKLNYNIHPLDEGEIAGKGTINPIVNFLLGMRSQSEFLAINPNGRGSINFDLDADALIKVVLGMVEEGEELECSFKGTISNGSLYVTGGHVYFPDTVVNISGGTFDDDDTVHIVLSGAPYPATITGYLTSQGNVSRTMPNATTMTLPLLTTATVNGTKVVRYYHVGDYAFSWRPAQWCAGYDQSATQSLDHVAGSDIPTWQTYEPCDN